MVQSSENTETFRILLIDDEPTFCQAVEDILRTSPVALQTLHDPLKTIAYAERILPHLILLDVYFLNTTGLEVLAQLKQHPKLQHIPVIMLTSSSQKEHIESSQALGAVDYLVKPFRIAYFQGKLNKHLPNPVFFSDHPPSESPHLNLFEPEHSLRQFLKTLLTNQGYRVHLSESIEAACTMPLHPPIALFNPAQDPEQHYLQYCQNHHIPWVHYTLDLADFPVPDTMLQGFLTAVKQALQRV